MKRLNPLTVMRSPLSGDVPLQLHPLLLSFFPSSFHPPTDGSDRGEGVPFLSNRPQGNERAAAGHETSSQASRPPRPKPLHSRALQRGHFPALWIFVQVKISREPSATKHSITFKWGPVSNAACTSTYFRRAGLSSPLPFYSLLLSSLWLGQTELPLKPGIPPPPPLHLLSIWESQEMNALCGIN